MTDKTLSQLLDLAMTLGTRTTGNLQVFNEVVILRGEHTEAEGWKEGELFYEVRSADESVFGDHGAARTLEEAFEVFLRRKLGELERKLEEQRAELKRHQSRNLLLEGRIREVAAQIEALNAP